MHKIDEGTQQAIRLCSGQPNGCLATPGGHPGVFTDADPDPILFGESTFRLDVGLDPHAGAHTLFAAVIEVVPRPFDFDSRLIHPTHLTRPPIFRQ
jgi:hypothetical protein